MAHVLVIYRTPSDPAAFDRHYTEVHVPLARKLPGLRAFELSKGPVRSPAGESGVHRIVTLRFDSMTALQAALASPEGQAAAADAQTLGPLELLVFDTEEA